MNRYFFFIPFILLSCGFIYAEEIKWDMFDYYKLDETRTASKTLTFKAEIHQKNCIISAGNEPSSNPTVHLGTVGRKAPSKSALVPVYFVFEQCDSQTIDVIEFVNDMPGAGAVSGGKDFISTKDPNLKIYLYSDYGAKSPFKKLDFTPTGKPIVIGEKITACYARAEVGPGDVDLSKFQANTFTGKGQFLVKFH